MRRTVPVLVSLAVLAAGATGCAGSAAGPAASSGSTGSCPAAPVSVAVTVNQWGDITRSLGGACATTTAIISSASVDPHDYEPTPRDTATLTRAQLVVENGAGYDEWATKALATLGTQPTVVDAGEVVGVEAGGNPHLFYSPTYVTRTADAITAQLSRLRPAAAAYFSQQNTAWKASMKPYDDALAQLRASSSGKTYESTETVADHLADAAGLTNVTPQRFISASEAEQDPSPGDVAAFQRQLSSGKADVLLYNTQTEGAIPEQLRDAATDAGVPVVDVTETVPESFPTYAAWQLSVVRQLAKAVGGS